MLPGFGTRHLSLLFCEITDPAAAARSLASLPVTSCADIVRARSGRAAATAAARPPWLGVALSFAGLRKVAPQAERMNDVAFKQGLDARRSSLLADPTDPAAEGYCGNWRFGRPGQRGLDVVLILADDDAAAVGASVSALQERPPAGLDPALVQDGARLPAPRDGQEPFGFCDDLSQPGLRGRLSDDPADLLTPRPGAGEVRPRRPDHNLVWPGEFILGYPGQDALDRLRPGPVVEGGPPWTRGGSLLVLRRLRQDVDGFRAFVRSAAGELAARHPALGSLTAEQLAAKLMGRWPSGAPLLLAPDADRPDLARDPGARNGFAYLEAGDVAGLLCPRAAHIRRAYPRDAATSGLTEANIETHRLLRRSIPYADGPDDQGLLFLAYQTSIERQFEFVTRAWLNNPHLHDTDDGHDPIAGQSFGQRGDRGRAFSIAVASESNGTERISLKLPGDWVVPTGGAYLFVPSLSALRGLPAQPGEAARARAHRPSRPARGEQDRRSPPA